MCDFGLGGGDVEGFETEAFYGGEDIVGGFGPAEGLWVGVDGVEVGSDRGLQFRGRAVDAAADLLFGDVGEEALDLIDPRAGGRGEVNMPSRPRAEPLSDRLGLVGGVVVHHEVDVEAARDIAFDLAQEAQELASAMTGIAAPDDLAGGGVESSEQAEGSVTRIVVGAPLDLARAHRQKRLRSVQRLDLALFVDEDTTARSGGDR